MAEARFTEKLAGLLDEEYGFGTTRTYEEAGILTMNAGLVVQVDGKEFQVTVVQSGGARDDEEDEDG